MKVFEFQERCTSLPTYRIHAKSLADAIVQWKAGARNIVSEEVEECYLVHVFNEDDSEVELPDMIREDLGME